MSNWFSKWMNRGKAPEIRPIDIPNEHIVEIVAHKDATSRTVEQAKEANKQLKQLLDENGFTIKIFLSAGGKTDNHHEH